MYDHTQDPYDDQFIDDGFNDDALTPQVFDPGTLPNVDLKTLYFNRPDGMGEGRQHIPCPKHRALVNTDTGHVYGPVSDRYRLVTHGQALESVEESLKGFPEYGQFTRSIEFSDMHHTKMIATYTFPEVEVPIGILPGGRQDLVNPTVRAINAYDGSAAEEYDIGGYRLICSNGLVIGKSMFNTRRRHIGEESRDLILMLLQQGLEAFSTQTEIWKSWTDRVLMSQQYEQVIDGLDLCKRDRMAIENEVEVSSDIFLADPRMRTLTTWIFFNILCQYLTHRVSRLNKRHEIETRLSRLISA